jgi:hypothetical protein
MNTSPKFIDILSSKIQDDIFELTFLDPSLPFYQDINVGGKTEQFFFNYFKFNQVDYNRTLAFFIKCNRNTRPYIIDVPIKINFKDIQSCNQLRKYMIQKWRPISLKDILYKRYLKIEDEIKKGRIVKQYLIDNYNNILLPKVIIEMISSYVYNTRCY